MSAMHIALISLLVSVISAGVSVYSAHLTGQQNKNAQEQEVVSLVTDMVQTGSSPTSGNSGYAALDVLGEAEEAADIISRLAPSDVSSVERYIVALGLLNGDDYQPALQLFTKAAREASDPRTAADSWREAAVVLYILRFTSQAERDIGLAKSAFDRPDVTEISRVNNIQFTDLFDIPYQVSLHCSTAMKEWRQAARLIQEDHISLDGNNGIIAQRAKEALVSKCNVPLVALKAISP
ncbi:MAG TPA: hypothetical protein VEJ84_08270 [Acidimicrobiales bacterium]|nr:hypothetical protein [Acidimicrobiales bacterium]